VVEGVKKELEGSPPVSWETVCGTALPSRLERRCLETFGAISQPQVWLTFCCFVELLCCGKRGDLCELF
jgi:hypothetical protein